MKKLTITLAIILCLAFNMIGTIPAYAVNVFKEGVYKATDFNISPNDTYNVQNVSYTDSVFVNIFDEDLVIIQSIRLGPNSLSYNLLPLKPNYRIVIIGNGEVFIK
ncbi:hypothetical protein [Clostridium sp.]|uniref:hypothetical protein n=1 Tax=Clostridium sp. TaxID=1506 RepID=UPI003216DFCD